jgi:urea transporter
MPFAIPALTAPFVFVTWLFLMPRQRLEPASTTGPNVEKPAAVA